MEDQIAAEIRASLSQYVGQEAGPETLENFRLELFKIARKYFPPRIEVEVNHIGEQCFQVRATWKL